MDEKLTRVIEDTRAHRARFEDFCRTLTVADSELVVPGSHWRVKEYISHLATIDGWVGRWFEAVTRGRIEPAESAGARAFDIDAWNEEQVVERRDRSVEALLEEAAERRASLFETMERFGPEQLAMRFDFRGRNISFHSYLRAWSLHDPAHAREMLTALEGVARYAEARAWVASVEWGAAGGSEVAATEI